MRQTQRFLESKSELAAEIFISSLLTRTLFMCFSTLNKFSLCLFPDKSCLDGNIAPASSALTGCCCTSLGKDEATQTPFILLLHVKKMKTGLNTNQTRQTRKLPGRSQRGKSAKASEDGKI